MKHCGRRTDWLFLALLFAASLVGCQLTPAPGLVACPLPIGEQAAKVLQVVPLGTPREDVLVKLKDAGITGNFGENQSIFYCNTWEQNKAERWHLNVVLLFDEHGRLYETRPSVQNADQNPGVQRVTADNPDPFAESVRSDR
jgi:hypothetical protein